MSICIKTSTIHVYMYQNTRLHTNLLLMYNAATNFQHNYLKTWAYVEFAGYSSRSLEKRRKRLIISNIIRNMVAILSGTFRAAILDSISKWQRMLCVSYSLLDYGGYTQIFKYKYFNNAIKSIKGW